MANEVSNIQTSNAAIFNDRGAKAPRDVAQAQTVSQVSSDVAEESVEAPSLDEALAQLQEFSRNMRRSLDFSVDSESGRSVVRVMDVETDQVVRQIPTEEAINIARNIERIKGILFEEQV
jgi:flagellar protein FlaG